MKQFLNCLGLYRFPLLSLALCILAYGLLIPWLGFYWDDWPLAWFSHQFGAQSFINYAPYRPVSGWLYFLSFSFLGESTIVWQLYALLWRWSAVLAFWWLLRLIWPKAGRGVEMVSLLFALYPGFSQQPIAVTYSMYFLYYTLFLFSLSLTLLALRSKKRQLVIKLGALVLSVLTMFSTEYFYGLELLRPLLIGMVLSERISESKQRLGKTLAVWLPYFLLLVIAFSLRYSAAREPGSLYTTSLLSQLFAQPFATLFTLIRTMLGDFFEAGLAAWARLIAAPAQLVWASRAALVYVAISMLGALLVGAFFWRDNNKGTAPEKAWARQALSLGAAALFISGLSFWLAELPMRLSFPWDRFTLPMAFGVALVWGAILQSLRVSVRAKIVFLSLLLGLSAGYHFLDANSYREEWERQRSFFQQFQWRAPSLLPGTALLSAELPLEHYTDNSLTAPLNWIYAQGKELQTLPYFFAYLDLRSDAELFGAGSGTIRKTYRHLYFVGNSEDVLIFYYAPPACLRILNPELDRSFPHLPQAIRDQVSRSNLSRISPEIDQADKSVFPYWSADPTQSWCAYFEKADLARQLGEWAAVASLGDKALALDDSPNHPAERTPFIEGYAMVGEWNKALQLTAEALDINPLMQPMLCDLWAHIGAESEVSAAQKAALTRAAEQLTCTLEQ